MSKLIFEKKLQFGLFQTFDDRPSIDVLFCKQVHGNKISNKPRPSIEADGISGYFPWDNKQPVAILTADCMPIIIEGLDGFVFIHSGWKGLTNDILKSSAIKSISPQHAFIGPHIEVDQYEVGAEFSDYFPNSKNFEFFNHCQNFSLKGEAIDILKSTYQNIIIDSANICTFNNKEFNSYRRNKTEKRNWNIYTPF